MPMFRSLLASSLAVCLNWQAAQAAQPAWQTLHAQTASQQGSASHPSIRYGHAAVTVGDEMLVTHGYFYDRVDSTATWMSDTWSMSLAAPYSWRNLNKGMSQEETYVAYADGRRPHLPAGRFGHSVGVHNGTMYMHGGHDGGISRHGRQNYEPGYDFDETWKFNVKKGSWLLLNPTPDAAHGGTPGKRYLGAAAVVDDSFVIYGGLQQGQGDVWALRLMSNTWELLSGEVHESEGSNEVGPGRRVGHTLMAVDFPAHKSNQRQLGVLLYGGRHITADGSALAPEVYFFDLSIRKWRKLAVAPGSPEPRARKYHGAASAWIQAGESSSSVLMGFIVGGTVTTPGLTCSEEAWAFSLDCGVTQVTWQKLPGVPAAIYDSRITSTPHALYTFGGHLCSDSKGDHPWHYVNEVHTLDLASAVQPPQGSCQVATALVEGVAAVDAANAALSEAEL